MGGENIERSVGCCATAACRLFGLTRLPPGLGSVPGVWKVFGRCWMLCNGSVQPGRANHACPLGWESVPDVGQW